MKSQISTVPFRLPLTIVPGLEGLESIEGAQPPEPVVPVVTFPQKPGPVINR